jgi:hypothetical protein
MHSFEKHKSNIMSKQTQKIREEVMVNVEYQKQLKLNIKDFTASKKAEVLSRRKMGGQQQTQMFSTDADSSSFAD